jgi:hypothetical protein
VRKIRDSQDLHAKIRVLLDLASEFLLSKELPVAAARSLSATEHAGLKAMMKETKAAVTQSG